MYSDESNPAWPGLGFPIRKSPDLRLFAPTRSLSQLTTSFIASMCLGILHTLLVALPKALDHVNDPLLSKIRDDFHYFILVSQNEVTAFRRLQKTIHICESTSIPNFQKTKKLYVELTGIEPATSAVQVRRSPNWATAPWNITGSRSSGPAWTRTTDLILIRDAL